jgi:general secretion pathway protein D
MKRLALICVLVAGSAAFATTKNANETEGAPSVAGTMTALDAAAASQETMAVNYKDTDITSVVADFSKKLNKTFIIDPQVRGRITVVAPGPISVSDAYDVFLISLAMNGLTTVEQGKFTKIVQAQNAERDSIDTFTQLPKDGHQRMMTMAWTLKNVAAKEVYNSLGPILQSRLGEMRVLEDKNILLASDYLSNLERIQKIIDVVDVPGKSKFARTDAQKEAMMRTHMAKGATH